MVQPATVHTSPDCTNYSFPFDVVEVRGRMVGQDSSPPRATKTPVVERPIPTSHNLTPINLEDNHASPLGSSPVTTPPPRFPSPAQLRAQHSSSADPILGISDDPFGSDEAPSSKASSKMEEDRVARSDSLNKLRQATLRRKKALEPLSPRCE